MNKDYNTDLIDKDEDVKSESDKPESFSLDVLDKEERDNPPSSKPIHKSMIIAEVVDIHPDVIPLLIDSGMHCIGCGASMFETLEEGFIGHGMDEREIDKIIDDINKYIKQASKDKDNDN